MDNNQSDCAVRIAVRERPILPSDHDTETDRTIIRGKDKLENVIIVRYQAFIFDHVLGPDVGQSELFTTLIQPMVRKLLAGFHTTVMAYGQTGTGKSYTMGLHSSNFEGDEAGMVPRTLEELFRLADEAPDKSDIKILLSFIEIYNEKAFDLLAKKSISKISSNGTSFTGATKRKVCSLSEARIILDEGTKHRHVRPTKLNANSSRSHVIFTIYTTVRRGRTCTRAAMNLVDLAGSEGVARTGHKGTARTEGVCINKGLLSINKVLEALSDTKSARPYIPYRDSVLTSALRDSLSLNSYLTLLVCVSPLKHDEHRTLSTLIFAQKSKLLRHTHTPQINEFLAKVKKSKERHKQVPNYSVSGQLITTPNAVEETSASASCQCRNQGTSISSIMVNNDKSTSISSPTSSSSSASSILNISRSAIMNSDTFPDSFIRTRMEEYEKNVIEKLDRIIEVASKMFHTMKTTNNNNNDNNESEKDNLQCEIIPKHPIDLNHRTFRKQIEAIKTILSALTGSVQAQDDCSNFGQYVANELKKIGDHSDILKIQSKNNIQKVLMEASSQAFAEGYQDIFCKAIEYNVE